MTIKKHMATLTLAAATVAMAAGVGVVAMAAGVGVAHAADVIDNQNSVNAKGKPNSGPGVQGAPDTRTGPATRAPGGEESGTANEGASSGASGSGATTQPSQDSSGVEGMPGNKSGPAAKSPSTTN
jgi:hypothetical protein